MKTVSIMLMIVGTFAILGLNVTSVNSQSGKAIVQIKSDTEWQIAILDSNFNSTQKSGRGNTNFTIDCNSGGHYSLDTAKSDEFGALSVSVIQDGKTLNSGSANAKWWNVTFGVSPCG